MRHSLLWLWLAVPARLVAQDFPALAEAVFSGAPFRDATVGALFVSVADGTTFYSRNPDIPLLPASNAKLATSAAALECLKSDFRFSTSFLIPKDERGKRAVSVLVWRGGGDPTISGRGRANPCEIFAVWGDSLAALGISKIKRLVLDDGYFEGPATVSTWPAEELSYWYAAQTSAISFNDNCVELGFSPGPRVGRRARIALTPDFGYVRAVNRAVTGPPGSAFTLDYRRAPGTNTVTFFGSIPRDGPDRSDFVSVHQPALFAAHTLRRVWKGKGLRVSRTVSWDEAGLKQERLGELFVWKSEPLTSVVSVINKNSQNFYAEQLLKTLGKEATGRGSFAAGLSVVRRFLGRAGLADEEFRLVDGSGLSQENRMTAAGLVRLLRFMHASPLGPAYYDSLAVPGEDKSVRGRMAGEPGAARMRLKPGTVAGARNLSGYLESRGGRRYAFSVLVNGPNLDRRAVDEAVDRLCLGAVRLLP